MRGFFERYFSFDGRLARLPFFIRGVYLGIIGTMFLVASIPLFANGARALWWAGLAVVIGGIAFTLTSEVSLIVRRLHDLGLAGYHAIWVAAAEIGWTIMSYGSDYAILLALPLFGVGLWLMFYPGQVSANRFG
jgi:uncharacterized membrane protein YhaH (DUF805 family)